MLRFAGIGGGTGLPMVLQGLRQLSERSVYAGRSAFGISAIVAVSDNGGSSGCLRHSFGIPAVGDLRNCLVALSRRDCLLPDLFQYRFSQGDGLEGHSLGNLIMTALTQMSGSFSKAMELASEVLCAEGYVLPATDTEVTLCADLESGERIRGEWQVTAARSRIDRVWLEPLNPPAYTGVLQALKSADAIIMGPGSLYTSIIPNLLVAGVSDAVRKSQALKIYVCNLVTQPGETDGFAAEDHLSVLNTYVGSGVVDVCILNSQPIPQTLQDGYCQAGSEPVRWDERSIRRMGAIPMAADLLSDNHLTVRHDPDKLACLIQSLTQAAPYAHDARSAQRDLRLDRMIPCAEVTTELISSRASIEELRRPGIIEATSA